jgi:hypothetical protein
MNNVLEEYDSFNCPRFTKFLYGEAVISMDIDEDLFLLCTYRTIPNRSLF